MSGPFEEQGWVRLGVSTALAKEYGADGRASFQMLAGMLEKLLPEEANVTTSGWFNNKKPVKVELTLDDGHYTLEDPGRGPLVATSKRVVRGIALKTDEMQVEEWLNLVAEKLEEKAKKSERVRNALGSMLGLS